MLEQGWEAEMALSQTPGIPWSIREGRKRAAAATCTWLGLIAVSRALKKAEPQGEAALSMVLQGRGEFLEGAGDRWKLDLGRTSNFLQLGTEIATVKAPDMMNYVRLLLHVAPLQPQLYLHGQS